MIETAPALPAVGPEPTTPIRPSEPTTPMRPSEAMRLGRIVVPARAVGVLARRRHGEIVSACALGAMAVGYGAGEGIGDDDEGVVARLHQ